MTTTRSTVGSVAFSATGAIDAARSALALPQALIVYSGQQRTPALRIVHAQADTLAGFTGHRESHLKYPLPVLFPVIEDGRLTRRQDLLNDEKLAAFLASRVIRLFRGDRISCACSLRHCIGIFRLTRGQREEQGRTQGKYHQKRHQELAGPSPRSSFGVFVDRGSVSGAMVVSLFCRVRRLRSSLMLPPAARIDRRSVVRHSASSAGSTNRAESRFCSCVHGRRSSATPLDLGQTPISLAGFVHSGQRSLPPTEVSHS
jgi:hypothetical protein